MTVPQVASLPAELSLQIIQDLFAPEQLCIPAIFDQCPNQWNCDLYHPCALRKYYPLKPDSYLSSIGPLLYEEGHKFFFRHNVFVFNMTPAMYRGGLDVLYATPNESDSALWKSARDPRTLELLTFVEPHLSAQEASQTVNPPLLMDRFSGTIRHLVLRVKNEICDLQEAGWEWPLKVDWKTLPHLKTLCLDLQSYSRRESSEAAESQEEYDEKLSEGALSMECLNLKRLILVGLCSQQYYLDKDHKRRMEKLFGKCVAKGVKIEFLDREQTEQYYHQW
ncbi:hypothetical protein LOCC1_G000075 [Lachnellula occidentalis]|uniref:F-box domain-containing protein n=1 Tax=Lachnellula occidentalis TaxID=215460 RepID=A0A8H8UKV0_9HELO|nr:hypothetical protein LOCC1_G000075 [Lachnellula occidentalis]